MTGEELLIVPIKNAKNSYINSDRLENIALEKGALKTYFNIKNTFNLTTNLEESESLNKSEFEKMLIKSWGVLKDDNILATNFETLKSLYENSQKDDFMKLFDKVLEEDFIEWEDEK